MVFTILGLGFIQKGFLFRFIKVRASFGKLVLVKIREINQDDYRIGEIEEGYLIYTTKGKNKKRIKIPRDKTAIYKSMGVNFIDVDNEKNAICYVDYEAVCGFDAEKNNDLLTRALYKPKIADNKDKLMLGLLIILIIVVGIVGYMVVMQSESIATILTQLGNMKGSITGGNTV